MVFLALTLDRLRQDVRYAIRTLGNQPAFTACAIATLAVGIGANTAMFTLVNGVLLKPLPFHDPDRIVRVTGGATFGRFELIRQDAQGFAGIAAFNAFTSDASFSTGAEPPEGVRSVRVSANFLSVLGVSPLHGRGFLASEEADGSCVVMVSERLWSHLPPPRTHARVSGQSCLIAGALPRGFAFPVADIDLWLPLQPALVPAQARRNSPVLGIVARLKPDVSVEQASEEVRLWNERYARDNPGALDAKAVRENVTRLADYVAAGVRTTLWMLMGAAALFLAIACANIASLFLVRARTRAREAAVRVALGASRTRLASQLLAESLLVTFVGAVLGVAGAYSVIQKADAIPGLDLPRSGELQLDGTVLLFAALLCVVVSFAVALAPSRTGSRSSLMDVLRTGAEEQPAVRRERWIRWAGPRGFSVIVQVALTTVLLTGGALLIVSAAKLRRVDLGFQPDNVLTMRLILPRATPDSAGPDFDALAARVQSIPGVEAAAVTLTLPATGFAGTPVWPSDGPAQPLNKRPIAVLQAVTPDYFRTLGIRVLGGRAFSASDSKSAPKVAILNEAAARKMWPDYPRDNPVDRSILAGASLDALRVVGIVADMRQAGIADDAAPGVYRPRAQVPPMSAMLAVRARGNQMPLANAIRAELAAGGSNIGVAAVKTMETVLGESEARRRGVTLLLTLFGGAGLLLTCVGLYGAVAYSVVMRTREFGIRQALGARPATVLRLVMREGLLLTAAGLTAGLAGSMAFATTLRGFLYEIQPTDPRLLAGVAALCLLVALAACSLPALRAMRIQPAAACRGPK